MSIYLFRYLQSQAPHRQVVRKVSRKWSGMLYLAQDCETAAQSDKAISQARQAALWSYRSWLAFTLTAALGLVVSVSLYFNPVQTEFPEVSAAASLAGPAVFFVLVLTSCARLERSNQKMFNLTRIEHLGAASSQLRSWELVPGVLAYTQEVSRFRKLYGYDYQMAKWIHYMETRYPLPL